VAIKGWASSPRLCATHDAHLDVIRDDRECLVLNQNGDWRDLGAARNATAGGRQQHGSYSPAWSGKSKYVPIDPGGEMVTAFFAHIKSEAATQ
jgi:hypothetical protein